MKKTDVTQWLEHLTRNAPVGFARDCAKQIQQTGYLTLGSFFANVSDLELKSILHLLHILNNSTDQSIRADSLKALLLLLGLLQIGSASYGQKSESEIKQQLLYFADYVLREINDRQFVSDNQLKQNRVKYSLDNKPEERK